MKKTHLIIVILLMVIAFMVYRSCNRQENNGSTVNILQNQIVVKGDSIPYIVENEIPAPKIIYRDTVITKLIEQGVTPPKSSRSISKA